MAEKTITLSDGTIERYDDRFVCRWHIHWDDDGIAESMFWCGLNCPVQRERIARNLTPKHVPHPKWDALAASGTERGFS